MNIAIISNKSSYKELFEKHEKVKLALLWDSLKEPTVKISAVYLDGETFTDINELKNVREAFPDIPVFYKPLPIHSDIITRNISRVCAAYKVQVLNEYITEEQIVEQIMGNLTQNDNYLSKRIISFFGTHSGAGVTTTTLNLARSLSQKINEKVLVLSLNSWDPADYYYNYQGHYLNDLKVDLKTHNLTPSRLSEAVGFHQSFYHLAGNRDIKMQRYYHPDEVQHLLDVAKSMFDLIIIDAGTHFDTAPTVQAYMSSYLKFLVTNQEEKGYRGYFPYIFQQIIEPIGGNSHDFMLVINKFQPSNTLISEKALEDELQMTKVATIPDMGDLGAMAAFQKRLLYDMSESSIYNKQVDLLSNLLISECRLTEKEYDLGTSKKEKKGLLSIFK